MQKTFRQSYNASLEDLEIAVSSAQEFPPGFPGHWERDPFTTSSPVRSLSRSFNFFDVADANFEAHLTVRNGADHSIDATLTIWLSDYDSSDLIDPNHAVDTLEINDLSSLFQDESLAWEVFSGEDESESDGRDWSTILPNTPAQFTMARLASDVLTALKDALR